MPLARSMGAVMRFHCTHTDIPAPTLRLFKKPDVVCSREAGAQPGQKSPDASLIHH